jgi:DNA-binding response OmpR family regulator
MNAIAIDSPRRRYSILIVESDRFAASAMCFAALNRGHDVLVAASATAAVELADEHQPDAIFVSLSLRHGDARDLLRTLRVRCSQSTTCAIIESGGNQYTRRLVLELADRYEERPVVPEVALNHVERMLERKLA